MNSNPTTPDIVFFPLFIMGSGPILGLSSREHFSNQGFFLKLSHDGITPRYLHLH